MADTIIMLTTKIGYKLTTRHFEIQYFWQYNGTYDLDTHIYTLYKDITVHWNNFARTPIFMNSSNQYVSSWDLHLYMTYTGTSPGHFLKPNQYAGPNYHIDSNRKPASSPSRDVNSDSVPSNYRDINSNPAPIYFSGRAIVIHPPAINYPRTSYYSNYPVVAPPPPKNLYMSVNEEIHISTDDEKSSPLRYASYMDTRGAGTAWSNGRVSLAPGTTSSQLVLGNFGFKLLPNTVIKSVEIEIDGSVLPVSGATRTVSVMPCAFVSPGFASLPPKAWEAGANANSVSDTITWLSSGALQWDYPGV